jgi:hypothetical protein
MDLGDSRERGIDRASNSGHITPARGDVHKRADQWSGATHFNA